MFYMTPTSMVAYLSEQIKNLVDLGIINTKSPITDLASEGILIRKTNEGVLVKTIFLNDQYAEQKQ